MKYLKWIFPNTWARMFISRIHTGKIYTWVPILLVAAAMIEFGWSILFRLMLTEHEVSHFIAYPLVLVLSFVYVAVAVALPDIVEKVFTGLPDDAPRAKKFARKVMHGFTIASIVLCLIISSMWALEMIDLSAVVIGGLVSILPPLIFCLLAYVDDKTGFCPACELERCIVQYMERDRH